MTIDAVRDGLKVAKRTENQKRTVFLVAYSADGEVVERLELPYEDYYDGVSPLIDSDAYRVQRGIRRLVIKIFNSSGAVQSEFENFYGDAGEYRNGRAVLADGRIVDM